MCVCVFVRVIECCLVKFDQKDVRKMCETMSSAGAGAAERICTCFCENLTVV